MAVLSTQLFAFSDESPIFWLYDLQIPHSVTKYKPTRIAFLISICYNIVNHYLWGGIYEIFNIL